MNGNIRIYLLLSALFLFENCEEIVHLRIVAPVELRGAKVEVDGVAQAVLLASDDGSVTTVDVTPFHETEIVVERAPHLRIVRRVLFKGYGTRKMVITPSDVRRALQLPTRGR